MDLAPVSVVIPAYNSQEFIGEAIASVYAQTLPVSEVIVVDDGSSDRTAELAEKHGAFVIRQEHRGISAARNAGIRAAKHDWIALQDADDIWEPRKIEYQWAAVQRYPDAGLVSCDLRQWVNGSPPPETLSDFGRSTDIAIPMVYTRRAEGPLLNDKMDYSSPTKLIRRDLLLSVGLFDESVAHVEGVECYLRVIARCSIVWIALPLVRQRFHQRNTSANSVGMRLAWIKMIEAICAESEKYPPGAAEVLGRGISDALIHLGRTFLAEGRMREARGLFARSLKRERSRRALFLWSLSFLNFANFKSLLSCKRKLISLSHRFSPGRETVPNQN